MAKRPSSGASAPPPSKRPGAGHWSMKLLDSMKNPDLIVQSDDTTVTIKDAYPKAKHHYLILPKEDIPSLKHLDQSHIPLLRQILLNGKSLTTKLMKEDDSLTFRHGYHSSPSMTRLHMHVISQDFISPCLKTKKHWNSFTSNFFVDAEQVIEMLESKGEVRFDKAECEKLLKLPLKCHKCSREISSIPRLKYHLEEHYSTLSK